MTILHGRNAKVFINGDDLSGDLNSVTIQSEQDLADVTVFGNVGHTFYPGMAKDSGTVEGLYNSTEKTIFEGMIQQATGYAMMVVLGGNRGDPCYATNEVMLKGNNIKSVVTDVNRVTVGLDVDNYPFEYSAMLTAGSEAFTTATTFQHTTPLQASSVSGTTGGAAYLQIMSLSAGAAALIVTHSSTGAFGGEQTTIATFTTVSSGSVTSAGCERIAITSQIQPYTRVTYRSPVAGEGGAAITFAVALTRY